ncbi:glyceraldehyde 3-phosphate dehydrogenase [Babesia caballi]|uniref:Glyceraldehyde 3-phosphate dehydrogenase n=1 Tax=Babesia caballi TaxID=5871 RepID=A0AAV4LQ16_BABCB|nr:glyceraldehyde 3-phosphate dehydrogenase [Babesia caballi]
MMKTAASIGRAPVGNVSPDGTAVDRASGKMPVVFNGVSLVNASLYTSSVGPADSTIPSVAASVSCSTCSWLLGDAVAASGGVGEAALSDEAELFAVVTGAPRRMPPPVDAISFTCPLLSSSAVAAADGSFISDASSVPFPATLPLSEDAVVASGGIGEAASPPVTLASSDDNFSTISLRHRSSSNVISQRALNAYSRP